MKISFVGAGNIATAIVNGIVKSGAASKSDIILNDISKVALNKHKENGFTVSEKLSDALNADIIFLTIKPQFYFDVLEKMGEIKNKTVVTVAPGITVEKVKKYLDSSNFVVRTMPNTPMFVGEGATIMVKDDNMAYEVFNYVKTLFEGSGKVKILKENLLDGAIGLMSSAPAYVYMFIEALADGGVMYGIDRETSLELAAQTVLGSAKMVLETGEHPAKLKDMVCSPNGTTIRAVKALEQEGFRNAVLSAMEACYKRAIEMK